jgi:uncharacterized protein (DUF2236 family)
MGQAYFDDTSILRRVHRERALALSGPRALLMQAAHPLAVSGLLAHTGSLEEPYERLERTAEVLNAIGFGTRREADRLTAGVRAAHSRVRGRLAAPAGRYPAGTPYRADDPELLLWVLYSLVDSALVVYRRFVGSLSRAEEAAYWEDYKVVGELFGLSRADMPESLGDLHAYGAEMLAGNDLHVTDWARTRAREIVLEPPVPVALRPAVEWVNFVTVALLPDRIRESYGFSAIPPLLVRRALSRTWAEYVRRALLPLLPSGIRLIPAARAT